VETRPVDERDTEWEIDLLNLRVFFTEDTGSVAAWDVDSATFNEAQRWAASKVDGTAHHYSIALRQVSDGHPGLMWIIQ
jgi:hypothetical protein